MISAIKLLGAFIILLMINAGSFRCNRLCCDYASVCRNQAMNRMRGHSENRSRIADINSQIEDSLSGIRVVKSAATKNQEEMDKFEEETAGLWIPENLIDIWNV